MENIPSGASDDGHTHPVMPNTINSVTHRHDFQNE